MPEITSACFHKLYAGKRRLSITDYFFKMKKAERCRISPSRSSKNHAPARGNPQLPAIK
ncbi:hypothetical protein [Ignatzschineria indica]|uniref:hypothetical protein n=1 Tax=Ignatzschineria indica TaxID=472583 RepID=UPI0013007FD8|nr:hypothetical protein [Ignatzschineria indica]